jgi:hypothetical protein
VELTQLVSTNAGPITVTGVLFFVIVAFIRGWLLLPIHLKIVLDELQQSLEREKDSDRRADEAVEALKKLVERDQESLHLLREVNRWIAQNSTSNVVQQKDRSP